MTEPTTPQLTEADVERIAARKPNSYGSMVNLPIAERDALIRDWRALRAEHVRLLSAVLIQRQLQPAPQTRHRLLTLLRDALREQLQEEQNRNQTQADSIMELEVEITALREQLAQAELAQERLQTAVQLALQGLNERCSEVAALQWFQSEYCFAVEKVRDADESTVFELRKGLPTLTGKQLPTGVGP